MKRDFLQNFKVGDQPLPKEIIDAIMAENGRDIESAKAKFSDYDTVKEQLAEAQKTIQGFQSQDIDAIKRSAADWERKYNEAIAAHEAEKAETAFQTVVKEAVAAAHGRDVRAVVPFLDMEGLRKSKNQAEDLKAALETVRKEQGYLFEDDKTPPPYAARTGGLTVGGSQTGVEAAFARLNPGLKLN